MATVLKNQLIDYNKSHPEKIKQKGIIHSSVPKTTNLSAIKKENKTASSACLKPSGFFSPKNQVSFSGVNETIHKLGQKNWAKKLVTKESFLNGLKSFTNLGLWESVAVFGMSITVKPLSLLAVPGAKKEDKKYAATKAILAGCVDFALTSAILYPLGKYTKKLNEKIKKNPELIKEIVPNLIKVKKGKEVLNSGAFKRFKTVFTYLPKFIMIPLRAALTIALIPPTLKVLFPQEAQNLNPKKQRMNRYLTGKSPINFSNNIYGSEKNTKLFKTFTGGMNYAD